MASKRRTPRIGKTGCLFWLFILLIIIVIFVYRGKGNLKETFSFLRQKEPKEDVEKTREDTIIVETLPEEKSPAQRQAEEEKKDQPDSFMEAEEKPAPRSASAPGLSARATVEEPKKEAGTAEKQPPSEKSMLRTKKLNTSLYFVKISEDGASVRPVSVPRTIEYRDSPITRTIESLLAGPESAEKQKGITSFIPKDTRLLSAHISSGHLTLNFNERFEENYTGREAIMLELAQVLFTAFAFEQVNTLTILIEGETKRYITGEGIPLKDAYTREDLFAAGTQQ